MKLIVRVTKLIYNILEIKSVKYAHFVKELEVHLKVIFADIGI